MYCRGIRGATTAEENTAEAERYKGGLKVDPRLLRQLLARAVVQFPYEATARVIVNGLGLCRLCLRCRSSASALRMPIKTAGICAGHVKVLG